MVLLDLMILNTVYAMQMLKGTRRVSIPALLVSRLGGTTGNSIVRQ